MEYTEQSRYVRVAACDVQIIADIIGGAIRFDRQMVQGPVR